VIEEYVTDEEYETYFESLNGLRSEVARALPITPRMNVLDLATGYGYFAIEVAKGYPDLRITGIDVAWTDIEHSRKNHKKHDVEDRVSVLQTDATRMSFPSGSFDIVVNFLGLEDIHMTRGREGVEHTFLEVNRVLRPGGRFCLVLMPPEEMETEAQRLEVELYSFICDATWLSYAEYRKMLSAAGFTVLGTGTHYTAKKLRPEHAEFEIRYACGNVSRIYGRSARPFEEVWARFGSRIRRHGLGHISKIMQVIAQKYR
jgi:ubiquinone/menaquinone biosynthesis C-methylase UbiE